MAKQLRSKKISLTDVEDYTPSIHKVSVSNINNRGKSNKISDFLKKSDIDKSPIVLTEKQLSLQKDIRNNILTIISGPAGTSKTLSACYAALSLLADGKVDKIILTKPMVESGENMGFLPGTEDEKVGPYIESYYSNFELIIGKFTLELLKTGGFIIVQPLAFMRGKTYSNSIMLIDEAQNCTMQQLMLWLTRTGRDSKAIIMGDVSQFDIQRKDVKLLDFINMIKDIKDIKIFEFNSKDIMRSPFLIEVVERYEQYKDEQANNNNKETTNFWGKKILKG